MFFSFQGLPSTANVVLELSSIMLKLTSPASARVTSLTVSMYLRPLLETLKRPPLMTVVPLRVQEQASGVSRDRMHSKLQDSPSVTSADFRYLVIPMAISERRTDDRVHHEIRQGFINPKENFNASNSK